MTRPSRREVLGAGAFTLLTGIAAAAIAKPDAENPASPVSMEDRTVLTADIVQFGLDPPLPLARRKIQRRC